MIILCFSLLYCNQFQAWIDNKIRGDGFMEFLSLKQTARLGILSEWRLRVLQKEGRLPGVKVGSSFLVDVQQLRDVMHAASKPAMDLKGGARDD